MSVHWPSRASLTPFFAFFQLLFYAEPTWLDRCLVLVGCIAAVGAGVPFPLIGIVFGQLVDNFNAATCDSQETPPDLQHSINSKVLLLVYLAIATFALIYIHILCWSIASQRLAQRIRDRYLKSLLAQDIAFFDLRTFGSSSDELESAASSLAAAL